MRRLSFAVAVVAALGALAALDAPADARTEKTLAYPRTEAWAAAVRFIRVDAHLKITEKDAEAGYVLFELAEENKTFRGALELVDVEVDGRHAIRFVMTIEDRPSWEEIALLTKLETKLRVEIGAPAPPATPKPKDPPPSGDDAKPGKDGDKKLAPPPTTDGPPISSTP